jgi:hypothetical protein
MTEQQQSTLLPHQQRVVLEKADLDKKISDLSAFLGTDTFASLSTAEQGLLQQQIIVQKRLSVILADRIELFMKG